MTTFARIGREYVAQIAAFVVALSDRLFIPAVFLRMLGVASFSAWSIAIATGGFVSVLEFGVTRFFTNRLIELVERGEDEEAARVYRVAVTFLVAFVVVALTVIALCFGYLVKGVGDPVVDRQLPLLAIPVTLAAAVLQLISVRQALYRAHREFVAETWIRLVGEATRVAAVVIGALAGFDLLTVCWIWLAATLAFVVLPIWVHTRIRYPRFADRMSLPRHSESAEIVRVAPGLWLQLMFTTLFATLPVLAIGAISAAPAIIAQFVLMRTLANFVRQILQMFANVFAIELARRHARGDTGGFATTFKETNRFLAAQTAVASATLFVLAAPLFTMWTGRPQLYDPVMLLLAILPPLLFPSMMLTVEALAYANRPWPLVRARLLQVALTVATFALLSGWHAGLRMMTALFVGECIGMGLLMAFSIRNLNPLIGPAHSLRLLVYSAVAASITFVIVDAAWYVSFGPPPVRLVFALAGGALAFAIAVPLVGMSADRRKLLIHAARSRLRRL